MAIDVAALSQRYGSSRALDGLTFTVSDGVVALVGVNGAGKSTLLRTLAGAQRPTSGTVMVAGLNPYRRGERSAALRRTALMPQTNDFPKNLTVEELVTSIAWFKGLPARRARAKAREAVEQVGLQSRLTSRIGQLSGGMARRVSLAQAIVSDPEALLLDEPSTGLDPEQRRSMVSLIQSLPARLVLFSSHVMEDVEQVASAVLVLDEARLIYQDSLTRLQDRGSAVAPAAASASLAEIGLLDVLSQSRQGRAA